MVPLASLGIISALVQAAGYSLQTAGSGPNGMDLKYLEALPILSSTEPNIRISGLKSCAYHGNGIQQRYLLVSEIKHKLGRGAQAIMTATQPGSEPTIWRLAIGSCKYIESLGVSVDLSQTPVKMRTGVTKAVVLDVDGKQAAVFVLEDTVRSDAQKVIAQLKNLGLTVGIITGDSAALATSVARERKNLKF
ncbi:hypothetical protein FGADI_12096 [Fusarium gaditjirri]|uniref:Uncharacterized protein n=1 Tax=Fusarium gaditjirri TaxID=282569 RepID=A0A8H4STI5_9HYPO|nr:hypothetical protein FGADI_12096 [Fusarium gaditjirri]